MLYKKRLGQHFIVDNNIIDKLVRHIAPSSKDILLEIGPGDGAMTMSLINKVKQMILIEKDECLMETLRKIINVSPGSLIINNDILNYDLSKHTEKIRVIGNLPYNISTEIIFKMYPYQNIIDIHFMLQREVVDRIIAKQDTKNYGRLSVMTQAYFEVKKLFNISEHVFIPKPKVKSSFIRLIPKKSIFENKDHENIFFEIVKVAFSGRRKMIKRSLKEYFSDKELKEMEINPDSRAENLSLDDYILISRYVKKI